MNIIIILLYLTCIITFISSLSVIISFIIFKKLHTPSNLYSTWISITGIGISIFPYLGEPKNKSLLCNIQGFIGTYFILVRIIVSALMTSIIYILLYPKIKGKKIKKIRVTIGHALLTWIIPGIISSIPFITSTYSKDSGDRYCWFESTHTSSRTIRGISFGLFYGIVWFITIYNVVTYYIIIRKSQYLSLNELDKLSHSYILTITEKLKYYPILSVIFWIIPTFHRIAEFCGWEPYPLSLISLLIYSSLGFFDTLVFYNSTQALVLWINFFNDLYLICFSKSNNKEYKNDNNDGNSDGTQTRPGSSYRDSNSTSRVIYHKRISPYKDKSKQDIDDLNKVIDENYHDSEEKMIDSKSNDNYEINDNYSRNSNSNSAYQYNFNETESILESGNYNSESDDEDDEISERSQNNLVSDNDDENSLQSVRSHLLYRKKKRSFLDLDFPIKLHKDEN